MTYGEDAPRNLAAHIVAAYGLGILDQTKPLPALAFDEDGTVTMQGVPVKADAVTREVMALSFAGIVDAVRGIQSPRAAKMKAKDLTDRFFGLDPDDFKGTVNPGEVAKVGNGIPPKVFRALRAFLRDSEDMIREVEDWIASHPARIADKDDAGAPWTKWPSEPPAPAFRPNGGFPNW